MNNNKLPGLVGVCLKTLKEPVVKCISPCMDAWGLRRSSMSMDQLTEEKATEELFRISSCGNSWTMVLRKGWEISVWPQFVRFWRYLLLTTVSVQAYVHPAPCTCLTTENCSTDWLFLNITQIWPVPKSWLNPVRLFIVVSLLTVVPQSLNTPSVHVLYLNQSGWNSRALLEEWHLLPSAFSLEKGWIWDNLPVSMMVKISQPSSLFTQHHCALDMTMCADAEEIMKSMESRHTGEKKMFYDGSFIPCCCWTASGYWVCNQGWKAFKLYLLDNK